MATGFKTPISGVFTTRFTMGFIIFLKPVLSVKPIVHMFTFQFQKVMNKMNSTSILLVDNQTGISGLVSLMNYKRVSGLVIGPNIGVQ